MLPIVWLRSANESLARIIVDIAEDDPAAAIGLHQLIRQAVEPAAQYPYIFRQGRVPGTREAVAHPNYLVVYRIREMRIEVIGVLHTRQLYP